MVGGENAVLPKYNKPQTGLNFETNKRSTGVKRYHLVTPFLHTGNLFCNRVEDLLKCFCKDPLKDKQMTDVRLLFTNL
ncbi:hypothetical protein Hanom_Chr16g01444691 [Helianthus anomalus]